MSSTSLPTGTVDAALSHATRLLRSAPVLAAEQASEILKVVPNHPMASLLYGAALRKAGLSSSSLQILQQLVSNQPRAAAVHYELGLALAESGQREAALMALRRAVALKPNMPEAWRAIGDQMTLSGDAEAADAAYAQQIKASTQDPRLLAAASALCDNQLPHAESLLREHLNQCPTDVVAIRMLAEVAGRLGRYRDAEILLARCLELAPGFDAARHNYAIVLNRQNKSAAAIVQIGQLLARDPRNPGYRNLRAVILARIGEYQESIEIYAQILACYPEQATIWMSYGHALATAGRDRDSIDAYRKCIELSPSCGEAYWSLANLKTFRFSLDEVRAMNTQLARADLAEEDRFHFHFAVGKALEDASSFAESFGHYSLGNQLRRKGVSYRADETTEYVRRAKRVLSREFFKARAGFGADAPDPIFIVGMPRAGSTLIEQILSSHSAVEGTMELPDIMSMARVLSRKKKTSEISQYPEALVDLSAAECRALGTQYLEQTRIQRKTKRPFFIDKMPNNFLHIGLIRLALPNARIIDARRHPMACCFSGFKQHFARGQHYTYGLGDIGRYYRDYVDLMGHFDEVLPGSIHRVLYENMVDDTAAAIDSLLSYCGLPFEPACLRFYENDRAVRTASSQQVRRPIFREGMDQWRHYEPWLGSLKEALGPTLECLPKMGLSRDRLMLRIVDDSTQ